MDRTVLIMTKQSSKKNWKNWEVRSATCMYDIPHLYDKSLTEISDWVCFFKGKHRSDILCQMQISNQTLLSNFSFKFQWMAIKVF